ncbi:S8 family peptidase [Mycoplasma procyoni]|uniref:S8 family peptidase n=1 Tax=Mycoplasma procyoni TaxID=568784 RepID=UPI00197B25E6|nr:S8 family peptidase [Mycoplasma procyoni]MBN3535126.1 S8 family peptidase [Mycoplasma procyoni]
MNDLLILKGKFETAKNNSGFHLNSIKETEKITSLDFLRLKNDLESVLKFWENQKLKITPLVNIHYNKVIAKSNRISAFFHGNIQKNNNSIVGAKISKKSFEHHIITHCVEKEIIKKTIDDLEIMIQEVDQHFKGEITHQDHKKLIATASEKFNYKLPKTLFVNYINDASHITKISVQTEIDDFDFANQSLITIYETNKKTREILDELGFDANNIYIIDDTTMLLNKDQIELLKQKAPFLISMGISDLTEIAPISDPEKKDNKKDIVFSIHKPTNEPIIGVIDTMFDKEVYFGDWVEFENKVNPNLGLSSKDFYHGTSVSSIIVDGPRLNPWLDDGCGNFRVKHFGVAKHDFLSSFSLMKAIQEIVLENKHIKVWNISLGSSREVNENFCSFEASILDKIQAENNVIFVVAGTNKNSNHSVQKVGAPADSLNSVVVNSVDQNKKPTDYSRKGPVLSFFNKPDISYYGGSDSKKIRVCSNTGESFVMGTSFAAPWIARKLAYLIEIMHFSKEEAKALLIHSATEWNNNLEDIEHKGYGVVPIKISDILSTKKDEIRFIINSEIKQYQTYNNKIPVPVIERKHPYIAKMTMVYFPRCTRSQGVDYTNVELDLKFGRMHYKNNAFQLESIDKNSQDKKLTTEQRARNQYRKWDNVKHFSESLVCKNGRKRIAKKAYLENPLWAIDIKTKTRLNTEDRNNLKFALVITLKELNGKNRIDNFVKLCNYYGWIVERVNIENRIDIFNKSTEKIEFD